MPATDMSDHRTMTQHGPVVAIGEILVEIMAEEPGDGFLEAIRLVGPFPSGAPAIFISQVARLGHPAGIVSCVGDDDFGRLNVARLLADGVDLRAVELDRDLPTGSAFVRYRNDGKRDFVFNIRHSASARTKLTPAACELLAHAGHLHVMGSSLFSDALVATVEEAIALVRTSGGSISFDPNVRKEILDVPGMRASLASMLRRCDIFLPSGDELTLLTEAQDEDAAVDEILSLGIAEIIVKRGERGATHFSRDGRLDLPAYPAREVDPTGAGDCFGATFVTCRLQGRSPEESLRYATASGALAVERRGPMEGVAGFPELDALIARTALPAAEGKRR